MKFHLWNKQKYFSEDLKKYKLLLVMFMFDASILFELITSVFWTSVFERYKSYSPYDIKESIRKEVKGDLEKSFLTLGVSIEKKHTKVLLVYLFHLLPARPVCL